MVTITGQESGFSLSTEPGISSELVSAPSLFLSRGIHIIRRIHDRKCEQMHSQSGTWQASFFFSNYNFLKRPFFFFWPLSFLDTEIYVIGNEGPLKSHPPEIITGNNSVFIHIELFPYV